MESAAGCGGGGLAPEVLYPALLCLQRQEAIFVGHSHRCSTCEVPGRRTYSQANTKAPCTTAISWPGPQPARVCRATEATAPSFGAGRPSAQVLVYGTAGGGHRPSRDKEWRGGFPIAPSGSDGMQLDDEVLNLYAPTRT
ncbi:hypothetical protein MAPG_02435 [Magnaporthiopsis poae ATCC 64411]|uniref:Uncharacterized protein n=1 Tax=Magnaporthiopsis poae (strain ATCC 64411 / 73-15) TaxID=644358 RepID=A0A0C4DRC7_MAGP6|nr:hypothetical protein MAPG_02435 [Magnaporthiopsis poae ATCC 64411]